MKKIISMLMIISFILMIVIGCGEKSLIDYTSKEIIEKSREKSDDLKNAEYNADLSVEFSGSENMGISAPINITMSGQTMNSKNFNIDIAADPGNGFKVEGSLYLKDNEMLVHVPMLSAFIGAEYVRLNVNEAFNKTTGKKLPFDIKKEEILKILEHFKEKTGINSYSIFNFSEDKEKVNITINNEEIETVKISGRVEVVQLLEYGVKFMSFALEDEEARKLLFNDSPEEELAQLKKMINNPQKIEKLMDAIKEFNKNNISLEIYFDNNFYPIRMIFDADVNFKSDTGEKVVNIKTNGSVDYFNIGDVKEIDMPEINEDKVKDFKDLVPNNK